MWCVKPKPPRGGFSLIELLAVIVIIVVLVGIVLRALKMANEQAKIEQCRAQMKAVVLAMEAYRQDHGSYPPHAQDNNATHAVLVQYLYTGARKYLRPQDLKDPWGRPFDIAVGEVSSPLHQWPVENARVISYGPDGILGTRDDLAAGERQ